MKKELFDKTVPKSLVEIQTWFASVITQKLSEDEKIDKTTSSGASLIEEAGKFVKKSHTLEPFERMEIYNRCYWFRLIDLFHENYELVVRLFGYGDFNQTLSIQYLSSCPPYGWDLSRLGDTFVSWLKKNYKERDKKLVINSAILDWAYQECFYAPNKKALDVEGKTEQEIEEITSKKFTLQPHIQLLTFPYNLLHYRDEFLKQPVEYWLDNDFPKLSKEKNPLFFVLFRKRNHILEWKEISKGAYLILKKLKKRSTLEEACSVLENENPELYKEAEQEIAFWLREWTLREWLVPISN